MQFVEYTCRDRIATIAINRADKKNALSFALVQQLREAFRAADSDENAKVVILRSEGDTFCAGADLSYLQDLQKNSFEENTADSENLKALFYQIYTMRKVVICRVQGPALAGGCGLATVCDFVFAVPDAVFGYPEAKIGFVPAIVMVFLLRKISEGRAKHLLLSGERIDATDALYAGMVYRVVSESALDTEIDAFARMLVESNSAFSMMVTKQMIAQIQALPLEQALAYAAEMNAKARSHEDCRRGIAAFLNKEKIQW